MTEDRRPAIEDPGPPGLRSPVALKDHNTKRIHHRDAKYTEFGEFFQKKIFFLGVLCVSAVSYPNFLSCKSHKKEEFTAETSSREEARCCTDQ